MDLLALRPADTPEYLTDAWLGCIHWALGASYVWDRFCAETGTTWTPPRTALDRLIDEATGAQEAVLTTFIQWVNVNIWGALDSGDYDEGMD